MDDKLYHSNLSSYLLLLLSFLTVPCNCSNNIIEVTSVIGGMAQLPCNVTIGNHEDSIRLILWFKDSLPGGPIYSVDSRNTNLSLAKHFSTVESIGVRASFDLTTNPSYLILDPLREEDIGEYKCRVDFIKGRTLTTIVNLKVIVPPSSIWITDSNGRLLETWAGPYDEASTVRLFCLSKGGNPKPSLVWYLNNIKYDQSYFIEEKNKTVVNSLEIVNISRDHLNSVLTCEAVNQLYPTSINTSITLDINLKPLSVQIIPPKKSLTAGHRVDVTCESMYSRPPAVLTWIKNKKKLLDEREIISESGNKTTSVLNFVPSPEDNGLYLICKAENIRLKNSAIESKLLLTVFFEPIISLVQVDNHGGLIKKGDSISLHCRAKANPEVIEYSWRFQSKIIDQVTMKNKRMNGSMLSIEKMKKEDSGHYKCSARNIIGYGESESFHLRVNYLPVCEPNQKISYGIGLQETVRVLCVVDASPSNVTFYWTFNDTQLPLTNKYPTNVEGLRSSILFTPFNRYDYGTLRCWSRNDVGTQKEPCLFNIIPAGRPESLLKCSKLEVNKTSIEIHCEPGYDGGLAQKFHLEVFKGERRRSNVIANLTSNDAPHFTVVNLHPSTSYVFHIYSSNIKGRSDKSILLTGTTLTSQTLPLEKGTQKDSRMSSIIAITVGLLIISGLLVSFILKVRLKSKSKEKGRKILVNQNNIDLTSYSSSLKRSPSQLSVEAKSPDIIPVPRTSLDDDTESYWANLEAKNENRRAIYISCKEGDSMAIPMKRILYNSIYNFPKERASLLNISNDETFDEMIITHEPTIEMTTPYISNV